MNRYVFVSVVGAMLLCGMTRAQGMGGGGAGAAPDTDPGLVDVLHDQHRLALVLAEDGAEDHHHELLGGVVVVVHQDLVHRRLLGLGARALLGRHPGFVLLLGAPAAR